MADRFQDTPCSVVVSNNYDTHGTITRASVAHLTPSQLESLFKPGGLYADMDAWFRTSFEMKACGTKTNGMYDWIMSSRRDMRGLLTPIKIDKNPSLLMPFVLGRQDSVINKDFWAITAGQAVSGYTATVTGPLTSGDLALGSASDRVVRVVNRYGIDLDAKWFVDRDRVMIFGRASGTATMGHWKVMASAVAADLSYIDVVLKSEGNTSSATPYDTAPTAGVLLAGGNNVNDYESWCQNRPTLDPRKRVPYWYQTMRRARRMDSEYMVVYQRLLASNKYYQEFGDLPMAERNRQDEEEFQKRWLNTFFFGKKISANQTLANWQSLESIVTVTGDVLDPGTGGKQIAYRANMEGVYEQLRRCDRVRDLQNSALNLYEFIDEIYRIHRARKSQGRNADSIDIFTDSEFAALFESAMVKYYKNEYDATTQIQIEEGKMDNLGFYWRSYKLKFPIGVKINIVTHEFFDDIASAFDSESIGSRGTFMLLLDMGRPGPRGGTIYPGTLGSNAKVRTLGQLNELARLDQTFACTMENITEEINLTSETCTAVVECPANSLWIENIARVVPVATGKTSNPSYTNLY